VTNRGKGAVVDPPVPLAPAVPALPAVAAAPALPALPVPAPPAVPIPAAPAIPAPGRPAIPVLGLPAVPVPALPANPALGLPTDPVPGLPAVPAAGPELGGAACEHAPTREVRISTTRDPLGVFIRSRCPTEQLLITKAEKPAASSERALRFRVRVLGLPLSQCLLIAAAVCHHQP